MTENPQYDDLIKDLERALNTAFALKSEIVIELLRMAILAAHEEIFDPKSGLDPLASPSGDCP